MTALMTSDAALLAGGIVPDAGPPQEHADVLGARAFRHAGLGDRVVVRISSGTLAPGVDLEMETLGFGAAEDRGVVGRRRRRALGFPGWALVHDPEHARFALQVVGRMEKAGRSAKTKAKTAKEGFEAIARELGASVPHFLPSFFEECGRVFREAGSVAFAAQMFEKAREAERVHSLDVDEAHRLEAFLEFALAGALSTKSLSAYAKQLTDSSTPERAFESFRELVVRRTLGGVPPWASMRKELGRLAKAAGRKPSEEDERLIGELLGAPALTRAPAGFWNDYEKAIERVARADENARRLLISTTPQALSSDGFAERWLSLLERAGSLDLLRGDGALPEGQPAAWVDRFVKQCCGGWRGGGTPQTLFPLLTQMAPRLIRDGRPLRCSSRYEQALELDVTEHALALDIPVADPPTQGHFDLGRWSAEGGIQLDPAHVAADTRLLPLLEKGVGQMFGQPAFEKAARGKTALDPLREAWLLRQIRLIADGGMVDAQTALATLANRTSPGTFAEFPKAAKALAAVRLRPTLQRTLQFALVDELGWPALDAAVESHFPGEAALVADGVFPHVCVTDGTRAVVVGPQQVELVHDLTLPKGATMAAMRWIGGALMVVFRDTKYRNHGYWSDQPSEVFPVPGYLQLNGPINHALLLDDGAVSLGSEPMGRHDRHVATGGGTLSREDGTYWRPQWENGWRLEEFDPRTKKKGRVSWPAWIEAFAVDGTRLHAESSWTRPLPEGVSGATLGAQEGRMGLRVRYRDTEHPLGPTRPPFEVEAPDGRSASVQTTPPLALASFPGSEPAVRLFQADWRGSAYSLGDTDGSSFVRDDGDYARGTRVRLPSVWWHLYEPRDVRGSAALRSISAEAVDALVDAAARDQEESIVHAEEAVASELDAISDPRLRRGVAGLAKLAANFEAKLAALAKDSATGVGDSIEGAAANAAVEFFERSSGGDSLDYLPAVRALLSGEDVALPSSMETGWERFIGAHRFFAHRALLASTAPATRVAALQLLRALGTKPLAGNGVWVHEGNEPERNYRVEAWRIEGERSVARRARTGGEISVLVVQQRDEPKPPSNLDVIFTREAGDDDEAWIDAFEATLEARGPLVYDPAIGTRFAEKTGVSAAIGALLWVGVPGGRGWPKNFLDKDLREELGLKVAEAAKARDSLNTMSVQTLIEVWAAAASGGPESLFEPLAEGGPVDRAAERWNARMGRSISIDERIELRVAKELQVGDALRVLASPASRLSKPPVEPKVKNRQLSTPGDRFGENDVVNLCATACWLFGQLPVGDPLFARIPEVLERVRAHVADPLLELSLGNLWMSGEHGKPSPAEMQSRVGGPVDGTGSCDGGLLRLRAEDAWGVLTMRPSEAKTGDDWERALALSMSLIEVGYEESPWMRRFAARIFAARWVNTGATEFIRRARETPVPAGSYEGDPRASVPELVAAVMAAHQVSEDAATLYLQTLAFLNPTKKEVLAINAWTSARYAKACEELAKQKLVLEAKRARAGRAHFLPGAWEARKSPQPPFETWKMPLYSLRRAGTQIYSPMSASLLPLDPPHVLFARAWERVTSGDAPAYEEVS